MQVKPLMIDFRGHTKQAIALVKGSRISRIAQGIVSIVMSIMPGSNLESAVGRSVWTGVPGKASFAVNGYSLNKKPKLKRYAAGCVEIFNKCL